MPTLGPSYCRYQWSGNDPMILAGSSPNVDEGVMGERYTAEEASFHSLFCPKKKSLLTFMDTCSEYGSWRHSFICILACGGLVYTISIPYRYHITLAQRALNWITSIFSHNFSLCVTDNYDKTNFLSSLFRYSNGSKAGCCVPGFFVYTMALYMLVYMLLHMLVHSCS